MNEINKEILVLALGNDIMGDDAAGIDAARVLKKEFGGKINIFEVSSAGFLLLDIMEGYEKVLIIDSIPVAAGGRAGSIRELDKVDLSRKFSISPHYVGLPELMELAGRLDIKFPRIIKALVIEINDSGIIREGLSPEIEEKIPLLVEKASIILNKWLVEENSYNGVLCF